MFENITNFFKKMFNKETQKENNSKTAAKERLHLVLMQDRANVSADFLDLMRQEIIEVIKKYIDVDEKEIDVRLTNKTNEDGTNGAPALYANIPIVNIKNSNKNEIEKNNNSDISEKENSVDGDKTGQTDAGKQEEIDEETENIEEKEDDLEESKKEESKA